jgi:hypothetical protein
VHDGGQDGWQVARRLPIEYGHTEELGNVCRWQKHNRDHYIYHRLISSLILVSCLSTLILRGNSLGSSSSPFVFCTSSVAEVLLNVAASEIRDAPRKRILCVFKSLIEDSFDYCY